MKKVLLILLLPISILVIAASGNTHYFEIARNLEIFASLYKEVNTYYVDEINPNQVIKKGIDAMLRNLDPYTVYIPEDLIEDYRTMATGEYGGVGALTGQVDGEHAILMIYEGYPAYDAGLRIGDIILAVGDVSTEGLTHDELGRLMKGQYDTSVELTVRRFGQEEPITFSLTRKNITVENVAYEGMLNEEIGLIKLTEFTSNAGSDVKEAAKRLKKEGATKLILDLRDNPGGLLHEAVNICNIFIPKNSVVVDTKGKVKDLNRTYKALDNPLDTDIPLVVLINSGSASASEIVAGVVQDYDRGVLVGRKSFGKGLVQATRPLSYNSQLKITTAKYYTPSGRCIQALDYSNRNPDGSVGSIPDTLKTAFKTTKGRTVYDGGGVDPDIITDSWEPAPVVSKLSHDGLIFDYATKFASEVDSISSARAFALSDDNYADFTRWVEEQDFSYSSKTEKAVDQLVASAKRDNYYEDIKESLEELKSQVTSNRKSDLILFEDDIREVLEEEIVSRYYYERGIIESGFDEDPDVLKAIEVLEDEDAYHEVLLK